jgi:DNA replication protein DnaC
MLVGWAILCDETEKFGSDVDSWKYANESDVAFIDDIGAEGDRYKNNVGTELLRRLLEERRDRYTMITTNVPADMWATRWDARVADRLLRGSVVVDLSGVPTWQAAEEAVAK